MKKRYLVFLLLFAVGIVACSSQPTTNYPPPSPTPTPRETPTLGGDPNDPDPGDYGEVLVTITIADDAEGNPKIASVVPESANLTGGMRVQWLVDNNSKSAKGENTTVIIGPFKGTGSSRSTKPFGPDDCANNFTLNFLKEGKESREISEQAAFESGETAYEYDVVLKAEDGAELDRRVKRPEIIVGGMNKAPTETKASPTPSPTATPRR
jgi:hypothetical protein